MWATTSRSIGVCATPTGLLPYASSMGCASPRSADRRASGPGDWRRDHAAAGITLGQADCLIAAAAVSIGVPLATANRRTSRCAS
jgi:hypothetical protein